MGTHTCSVLFAWKEENGLISVEAQPDAQVHMQLPQAPKVVPLEDLTYNMCYEKEFVVPIKSMGILFR